MSRYRILTAELSHEPCNPRGLPNQCFPTRRGPAQSFPLLPIEKTPRLRHRIEYPILRQESFPELRSKTSTARSALGSSPILKNGWARGDCATG